MFFLKYFLAPLTWWHPFICSLPDTLVDILEAPVPLMLGLNAATTTVELPFDAVKVKVRGEKVEVEGATNDGLFPGMREAMRRGYDRGEVCEA
jgi:hypothetical protein